MTLEQREAYKRGRKEYRLYSVEYGNPYNPYEGVRGFNKYSFWEKGWLKEHEVRMGK